MRPGSRPKVEFPRPASPVSRFLSTTTWGEAELPRRPCARWTFPAQLSHRNARSRSAGQRDLLGLSRHPRLCPDARRQWQPVHKPLAAAGCRRRGRWNRAGAAAIVYGHHDLLPANFLEDADGRLWLIDYEYAGFGTAMFDLAGAASE
ncbi:MAG: phosphotransferase [Paracoccaceae bacterium]